MVKGSNVLIPFFRVHGSHLVQDLGEVRHQDRNHLLQQGIGNAGCYKGLSCTNVAPKQKAKVFRLDLSPFRNIFLCPSDRVCFLRCIKPPIQQVSFLDSCRFHPLDLNHLFPGFRLLFLPAHFLLLTLAYTGQRAHLSEEHLPALDRRMAFFAVKQSVIRQIFAIVRLCLCLKPVQKPFQKLFHKLSPAEN